MIALALLVVAFVGAAASTVFLGLALLAGHRFRRAASQPFSDSTAPLPPVTMLKPVHGMEPRLEQHLESFFLQDYPAFEIIFGARAADDPALTVVETLRRRHPHVPVQVVLSGEPPWPNAKVWSLQKMVAAAAHDLLVISDSDVRVAPRYLAEVCAPLRHSNVGLVTCIYRGVPTGGPWSLLEALGMSVEFASGVLIANLLEGMKFALGPTMALRRQVLEKIGGVGILAEYCADDFVLGSLVAAAGFEVRLSHHVIDHVVLGRSLSASLHHQVRWMKSTRFSRPLGHIGSGLTFAVPFALLGLAAGFAMNDAALGIGLFTWGLLNRMVQSLVIGWGAVRDPNARTYFWLYPLRDLLGFLVWCASFFGRGIEWRGERYRLERGGKMARI
ncbi:MAG: bacteriohopanetetrol glucosamine biosynthesis glycosyltransferase HpnI [Terriglobales bacterium]